MSTDIVVDVALLTADLAGTVDTAVAIPTKIRVESDAFLVGVHICVVVFFEIVHVPFEMFE